MFAAGIVAFAALSFAAQPAEPQPTEASPGPVLALPAPEPDPLRANAETYASYHAEVDDAGRRELRSGADLDLTMDALAGYYEGDRLVDAQIAYAALVASQHPEFIDAVRALADYYGIETARAALMDDPVFITGFMGADLATGSVVDAIDEDVSRIRAVGDRYRQAAYDLQHEAWAQRRARDRRDRLTALETAADRLQVRFSLDEPSEATDVAPLGSAAALFTSAAPIAAPTPELSLTVGEAQMTPDERRVGRMLAVAALQSIESGDMTTLNMLLDDPAVDRCIAWARLDLAQCVAAGHFKYEDSFCIAEHALLDVADCLTATRPLAESVSN